jgi:hypothetical protein
MRAARQAFRHERVPTPTLRADAARVVLAEYLLRERR